MLQPPVEAGPVGRAEAGLLRAAQHRHAAFVLLAPLLGQVGRAVRAPVVDHEHLGVGARDHVPARARRGCSRPRCRWAGRRGPSRRVTLGAYDAGRWSPMPESPPPPRPSRRRRPPPALPSVAARVLGFVAIVVAGAIGGFIGYGFTDLQCTGDCATPDALGALIGADHRRRGRRHRGGAGAAGHGRVADASSAAPPVRTGRPPRRPSGPGCADQRKRRTRKASAQSRPASAPADAARRRTTSSTRSRSSPTWLRWHSSASTLRSTVVEMSSQVSGSRVPDR